MRKLRLLLGLGILVGLAAVATTALASSSATTTCTNGVIRTGTYQNVRVTGNCTFSDGTIIINGNLSVAPGAILNDHAGSTGTVRVKGNAEVGKGGVLGLGTYANPPASHEDAVVGGNVIANGAASLYLSGMTVRGNVMVNGGGDPTRNLPIKDDTIGGNLIIHGWSGLWFGVIRDIVGGNVIVEHNTASNPSEDPGSDSSEIVTNTISGNLICHANVPAAQFGDTGGLPNTVGGQKIGECAGL